MCGCAGSQKVEVDWLGFKTVALQVETRVDEAERERAWLARLVKLEIEKSRMFDEVVELKEGRQTRDLHIYVTITRVKRWLGRLKLFLDVEFVDGRTQTHVGRRRIISKSTIPLKGSRSRHKAAGQIAVNAARVILYHLRERRTP